MKKIIFSTLLFVVTCSIYAQRNSYFVYFSNKAGTNDYPFSLNRPEEFLTSRSLERRNKQKIDIDSLDLPVNPRYILELNQTGASVFFSSKWLNGVLIQMDTSEITLLEKLTFIDSVAWISDTTRLSEKDSNLVVPPSEFIQTSLNLSNDLQNRMLNIPEMHQEGYQGRGIRIAVLDNGFVGVNKYAVFQHLWENNQLVATRDFVTNSDNVFRKGGHGTSVLSIISGKYTVDPYTFIGSAPEASFILCITEDNQIENRIEEYNWVLGAEFADSLGADIISSSLGYTTFDIPLHNYTYKDLNGSTSVASIAAHLATKKGILVVISAGNSGNSAWRYISIPTELNEERV